MACRHGCEDLAQMSSKLIPFGAMLDFIQQPAKENKQVKYAPRTATGIYYLQHGGKWKGDYLCTSTESTRRQSCL
eukprot:5969569-Amphidinium_carterae.1